MNLGPWIFFGAVVVVVMVHESGHFLMAKLFDFKATKFFFGFGPTLWSFTKGETEYGVKLLPFGGFVRIVGMSPYEEVPPEDEHRSYPNKPRWQRALVLVAGSATHWVVAFLIIVVTAMTVGFPTGEVTPEIAEVSTRVEGEETPAAIAGFQLDDRIVAVESDEVESWSEVSRFIKSHPEDTVTFTVERDGRRMDLVATLGSALFEPSGEVVEFAPPGEDLPAPEPDQRVQGFLGISPTPEFETEGLFGAITESGRITWDVTKGSVLGIPTVFAPVFNGDLWEALQGEGARRPDEAPIGLVGVSRLASQSVERGSYLRLIELIVYFTIFVGIMNLLPLPPLDGGHLAVVGYEAITGRTVDVRKLIPLAAAVISFFLLLFLAVLILDIRRPLIPF